MKKESKQKSTEHISIGIAKIIRNYTDYALLINACDVAKKRYETITGSTGLSTTQNILQHFRLDSFEIDVQFTNEEVVEKYKTEILKLGI